MKAFLDAYLPPRQAKSAGRCTVLGSHDGIEHSPSANAKAWACRRASRLHVLRIDAAMNRVW